MYLDEWRKLEWSARLETWRKEIKNHFFIKLGSVPLFGFITKEQLSAENAAKRNFKKIPVGTKWGKKWEYGWFKTKIVVPKEASGKRIVFYPGAENESVVFVNGKCIGSTSWGRKEITLALSGKKGQSLNILMEIYAGHWGTRCSRGPVPFGDTGAKDPGKQQKVAETYFGIWDEDAYGLWADVETLYGLMKNIDPDSLRAAEIVKALQDFTTLVDFELPYAEKVKTFVEARKRLSGVLKCKNGPTTPEFYAFGHGHLDVAWLWPLAETERKSARTFSNQLELADEYPWYKFLQSEPHLYWMLKNKYPKVYERVKKAVKAGKIIADGSMWVEPDMNIAGGEALIRQCLYGKRFFKEEFGINNELLWLPDVFGYSGSLPQILKGCGVNYFATCKIFWNYYGGDNFPFNTFMWEGIDGSKVLAHLFKDYESSGNPGHVIKSWNDRAQKTGTSKMLYSFGYGDGGGGPVRDHLEYIQRVKDLEGCPKVKVASPTAFFKQIEKDGLPEVKYSGELYFQAHRGTYTSQAKTKKGNRKGEIALRSAELWSTLAKVKTGLQYPVKEFDNIWRDLLLNQFHDILPGSSIERVYIEAESSYAKLIGDAGRITEKALGNICGKGKGLTVFNSLSWERTGLVAIPSGWKGANDAKGRTVPVQVLDGKKFAEVTVPSCGWSTLVEDSSNITMPEVKASKTEMENELVRIKFNANGEITEIIDKVSGKNFASGLCNSFKMYKDIPANWDAWDIDSNYTAMPVKLGLKADVSVLSQGPLAAVLKIEKKINNSELVQYVTLRKNSRRVDFMTEVDWKETHKLLKVAFPVNIYATEAVHEIQFGHLKRSNNFSRQFDADRFEVSNHKWSALVEENRGFAVLNDCKYGLNVSGNSINLSLLRAAKAPDENADIGKQSFTYSFYFWNGSFTESGVVREGYELNVPFETAKGSSGIHSEFALDNADIIIDTVKLAEDNSGDIILRLYEPMRTAVIAKLKTCLNIKNAWQCDMLEGKEKALEIEGSSLKLEFRPFEIKTVRLKV